MPAHRSEPTRRAAAIGGAVVAVALFELATSPTYDYVVTAPILHLTLPVRDLDEARRFYEDAFRCRVGRVREHFLDVWFFGLQLTLQDRPEEVVDADEQGVRHFGVVLQDSTAYEEVIERLRRHEVHWLDEPRAHSEAELSGKRGGKLADPSGNVIEIKYYDDPSEFLGFDAPRSSEN